MNELTQLHEHYVAHRNPMQAITKAMLDLSDCPEFLTVNIRNIHAACEADLQQKIGMDGYLIDLMTSRRVVCKNILTENKTDAGV